MTTLAAAAGVGIEGVGPDAACWVEMADGLVARVGVGSVPPGAVDLGDTIIVPGFVDLQVNGVAGFDFSEPDEQHWREALTALGRQGATACLPTLTTRPRADYEASIETAVAVVSRPDPHACVALGLHLEGPFLGAYPGAHDVAHVTEVGPEDLAWLTTIVDEHPGLIRVVTLAPEADPGFLATRLLAARGVVVSFGHSGSDHEAFRLGALAGAQMATHLFNAMAPLHHRAPGPAAGALEYLAPTVIGDLVHVDAAVIRLAARATDRLMLVSDQVCGRGLVPRGGAFEDGAGMLCGSATSLAAAVANIVRSGVDISVAVSMASSRPAEMLGDSSRGVLSPGRRADVVALDRVTLEVKGVWSGGERLR